MKLPAQTPSREREKNAFWCMAVLLFLWAINAPLWAGIFLTAFQGLLLVLAWIADALAQDYFAKHGEWPPGYRGEGLVDLDADRS